MNATSTDRRDPLGYYATLEVDPDASNAELRMAFRRAVRRWHPDRNHDPQANECMRSINEAAQVLLDPDRRAAYDLSGTAATPVVTVTPEVLDFATVKVGEVVSARAVLHVDQTVSLLAVPVPVGSWWRVDVVAGDSGDVVAYLEVTVTPAAPGDLREEIVFEVDDVTVTLPVRVTVVAPTPHRERRTGVGRSSPRPPTQSPPWARTAATAHMGGWRHGLSLYCRVGVVASAADLLLGLMGLSFPLYVQPPAASSPEFRHLVAPLLLAGLMGLAVATRWFRQGGAVLKVAACTAATIGWGVLVSLALIVIVGALVVMAVVRILFGGSGG